MYYVITIKGHLDSRWSEWFDGLTITHQENGTTVLAGRIVDQTALQGILNKVRDLGLPLVAVYPGESAQQAEPRRIMGEACPVSATDRATEERT
jgi:hypothetical protein